MVLYSSRGVAVHQSLEGLAARAWGHPNSPEAKRLHSICTQEAEREEEVGPGYKTSKPAPSDRLPPARLHFLKAPDI